MDLTTQVESAIPEVIQEEQIVGGILVAPSPVFSEHARPLDEAEDESDIDGSETYSMIEDGSVGSSDGQSLLSGSQYGASVFSGSHLGGSLFSGSQWRRNTGSFNESTPLMASDIKSPQALAKRLRADVNRESTLRKYLNSMTHSVNTISASQHVYGLSSAAYASAYRRETMASKTLSLPDLASDDRFTHPLVSFFTVLGMLLGLSVFALPYLVARGGITMIVMIILGGLLTCYSALLINSCQYQESKTNPGTKKRVYENFVDLGKGTIKRKGDLAMQLLTSTNLMSDIYCLIFCGQVTVDLFKNLVDIEIRVWMIIWMAFVVPLFFITRMSILAWLALVGLVMYVICLAMSYGVLISSFNKWTFKNINHPFDYETFFIGYGIILNCYNVHLAIPALEASCKKPKSFPTVVKTSFAVNTVLKISIAVMASAAFGLQTQGSFLVNLSSFGIITTVINCVTAVYLYAQYPTSMFVVMEMIDTHLQPHFYLLRKGTPGHYVWMVLTRVLVGVLLIFIAVCIPSFELVAGFVGNLRGTLTTLVLPVYFYLRIKKRSISRASRIFHWGLIVFGSLMGLVGMAFSVKGMIMGTGPKEG